MEFGEKLQALRRGREMTQEELAHALYVSRTAISKWESGRGYPNIDSLKAISKYFAVSIDELLSGDALLSIAEDESREREARLRSLTFGLLDCAAAMLLFLPSSPIGRAARCARHVQYGPLCRGKGEEKAAVQLRAVLPGVYAHPADAAVRLAYAVYDGARNR